MEITAVSSPKYSSPNNSSIDCMVTFDTLGTVPYTAAAHDIESYGQALWSALIAGTFGPIAAYTAPTYNVQQQVRNAIGAGISLTSTGTPALNGTYAIDPASQANINAIITYVLLNSTFPGGGTTLPWYDISGDAHLFPSIEAFQAFATAAANFIAMLSIYANSNGKVGSIPSNAITIP